MRHNYKSRKWEALPLDPVECLCFQRMDVRGDCLALLKLTISSYNIQCYKFIMFNDEARQFSCGISAGIDVDPIVTKFRLSNRSVSMNDHFSEASFMTEEFMTDPKQILFALLFNRHAGLDARMDKKEITAAKRRLQHAKKTHVVQRQHGSESVGELALFLKVGVK